MAEYGGLNALKFTVNMILDILSDKEIENRTDPQTDFAIDRLELLSAGLRAADPAVLYAACLSGPAAEEIPGADMACAVCTGEEESVERLLGAGFRNLLILPAGSDLFSTVNTLLTAFRELNDWENELKGAMLAGKSLQTLAEIGGRRFGENPLVFGNSAYNIVGRSMTGTPYNGKVSAVLERGYFVKEEADALSRMGYPARRESYRNAALIEQPTYVGCPFFLITFPSGIKHLSYLAVYFVKDRPTAGLLDLFRILAGHVKRYCESMQDNETPMHSALEMFMDDLILHTHDDELYLRDRARQLQLPTDESYRLGLVQWEEYSRDQADYVLWRVRYGFSFPIFRVMRYHDSLLLVLKGGTPRTVITQRMNEALREVPDILSVCGGHIGFSTEVNSLLNLDVAYRQACASLKFGRRLSPDDCLYFYSTYYIYDMIESYGEKIRPEDMFVQKLRLLDNFEEGRYNNLHLLRNYLLSDRSLSATARMLHLHRNSVIYRLGKIENVLGVDLDDPEVRLRLLISFKILEYLDGRRMPDYDPEGERELSGKSE